MKKLFALIIPLLLSGCGHTMYHKVEGTGLYGRIPTPNGGSLIEVAIGDMNITSGILRGGATLDENTSKGGTFGSVSIARHTYLSTEPAMNEGNIRDVLISAETDPKTKQLIAEYLISRKQNIAPTAAVTSVNSASATGDKDSIPQTNPTKIGLDNVVDKVTEVAPQVVKPIAENTKEVVNHVSDKIESGTQGVVNNFWNKLSYVLMFVVIGIVIIVCVMLFFGKTIFKKKSEEVVEDDNSEQA